MSKIVLICDATMMSKLSELAKQLVDGHDVELWNLDRYIDTFRYTAGRPIR